MESLKCNYIFFQNNKSKSYVQNATTIVLCASYRGEKCLFRIAGEGDILRDKERWRLLRTSPFFAVERFGASSSDEEDDPDSVQDNIRWIK